VLRYEIGSDFNFDSVLVGVDDAGCWAEVEGVGGILGDDDDDLDASNNADLSAFISPACFATISFSSRSADESCWVPLADFCIFLDGIKTIEFRCLGCKLAEDALHFSSGGSSFFNEGRNCSSIINDDGSSQ